jgi:guanylate kinase
MIFILPPSDHELEKRISSRGRDSQEVIARRLSNAGAEIDAGKKYYQHFVINESLEKAIEEVIRIIEIN